MIADGTGVVFVPAAIAEAVIARAEAIAAAERRMTGAVAAGRPATAVLGENYETLLTIQD